jgi:hypothetical protein
MVVALLTPRVRYMSGQRGLEMALTGAAIVARCQAAPALAPSR